MLNSLQDFAIGNKITIPTNHHLVVLSSNVCSEFGDVDNHLIIELEPNSSLQMVELDTLNSTEIIHIKQSSGSNLFWFKLIKSSLNSRLDLQIDGKNTKTQLFNLVLPESSQQVILNQTIQTDQTNNQVQHFSRIVQKSPSTVDIKHKLIANWSTQNLTASQKIEILNLHPKAKQSIQPILQIDSSSVNCNHGATLSYVEELSQKYLQSRGLSRESTQKILVSAFVRTLVNQIPVLCLQEEVIKNLE
jgi:Fe-S cluster assembly protein SufD